MTAHGNLMMMLMRSNLYCLDGTAGFCCVQNWCTIMVLDINRIMLRSRAQTLSPTPCWNFICCIRQSLLLPMLCRVAAIHSSNGHGHARINESMSPQHTTSRASIVTQQQQQQQGAVSVTSREERSQQSSQSAMYSHNMQMS